jgi:hypothetical protein
MVRTNEVNGLNAILALSDDLDSAYRIQEVFELFARKPFIVDDQRSHCHSLEPATMSIGQNGWFRIGRRAGGKACYPQPGYDRSRRSRGR